MRTYNANIIVLKRINLGEKDRIITALTREYGKLSIVAKGSRRPGNQFSAASEPLTYSKAQLGKGKELEILTQIDIKESFPKIRDDIKLISYGLYMLELTNAFIDEHNPHFEVFDSLLSALYVLENGADPEITARYYEINLLGELGYTPNFYECTKCGKADFSGKIYFSAAAGGCFCSDCNSYINDGIEISANAASYFSALQNIEPNKIKDLSFPPGAKKDLSKTLQSHIRYLLEHDLKSLNFLALIEEK